MQCRFREKFLKDLSKIKDQKLCESRVQMQVGSGDTAHGRLPWRVSPLSTHDEPEPLIRIINII